ncbi:solute carrier family 23 protein, partial [Pseudomonas sp.]|uniref:solute carrier family 23 protein n=1 Tax=Pseudomonas sp. TaxID=306 RepID=UPI0027332A2A
SMVVEMIAAAALSLIVFYAVGKFSAGEFAAFIGAVLMLMPKPVLGGATLIMFGTVAVAGIKILQEAGLHRRNMLIVAISLGLGLGVAAVPEVLSQLPQALHNIFESPITVGAFSAILLNIFLPEEHLEVEEDDFEPEAQTHTVLQNPQNSAEDAPGLVGGLTPSPRLS